MLWRPHPRFTMNEIEWMYTLVICFLSLVNFAFALEQCSGKSNIRENEIRIADTYNFTCQITGSGHLGNSSDLWFRFSRLGAMSHNTHIINNLTSALIIRNITQAYNGTFFCHLQDKVCAKEYLKVLNPSLPDIPSVCIYRRVTSSRATVTWVRPPLSTIDFNHISIRYRITTHDSQSLYKAHNRSCKVSKPPCDVTQPFPCTCPEYSASRLTCTFPHTGCFFIGRSYTFQITGYTGSSHETLIEQNKTYTVRFGEANFCLESPLTIVVVRVGQTSVDLTFSVHDASSEHLDVAVETTQRYDNGSSVMTELAYTVTDHLITLTNCTPLMTYSTDVKVKYQKSNHWSNTASVNFTTLPVEPLVGPSLLPNSIYFTEQAQHNTLSLYWQKIPERSSQGAIVNYMFSVGRTATSHCTKLAGLNYTNVLVNTTHDVTMSVAGASDSAYRADIRARNRVGYSPVSTIYIGPSHCYLSYQVDDVTAELQPDASVVIRSSPVTTNASYHVHYCIGSKSDRTFTCKSDYRVEAYNGYSITLNLSQPDKHIYGVSSSLGAIAWSPCLYRHDGVAKAPNSPITISLPDGGIRLSWEALSCHQSRGIILRHDISVSSNITNLRSANLHRENLAGVCDRGTMYETTALTNHTDIPLTGTPKSYFLCVRGVTKSGPGNWAYISATVPPAERVKSGLSMSRVVVSVTVPLTIIIIIIVLVICYCRCCKKGAKDTKIPFEAPPEVIDPYFANSYYHYEEHYDQVPIKATQLDKISSQTSSDSGESSLPSCNDDLSSICPTITPSGSSCSRLPSVVKIPTPIESNVKQSPELRLVVPNETSLSNQHSKSTVDDGGTCGNCERRRHDSGYQGNQSFELNALCRVRNDSFSSQPRGGNEPSESGLSGCTHPVPRRPCDLRNTDTHRQEHDAESVSTITSPVRIETYDDPTASSSREASPMEHINLYDGDHADDDLDQLSSDDETSFVDYTSFRMVQPNDEDPDSSASNSSL